MTGPQSTVEYARALAPGAEAVAAWRELLAQTHVDETDYSDWARELAEIYIQLRRGLSAARIYEYLVDAVPALQLYREFGTLRDQARVLRLSRQLDAATEAYRAAGLLAHAAVVAEENRDYARAQALFEQLVRSHEVTGSAYACGLAALNAGRLARRQGHHERAAEMLALATRLLEQEADSREQTGDREGAFRCYLCLVELGKIERSYENLAEGFLNCIRILKLKSDRFFTMQYYNEFIALAEELGEHHSVAELYREAGEYARRVGFIYGDHFLYEAGNAWSKVAEFGLTQGNPTELVENALLAAASCFNRVQDDGRAADCYGALADLALPETRIERYRALAHDLRAEARPPRGAGRALSSSPQFFTRRLQIPDIWLRDLVDQENGHDIPDAIGRLVGDHQNVWEVQRRKALLISLDYDDHLQAGGRAEDVSLAIIEGLGELGHVAAVRPLQALYDLGDESRKAVIIERASLLKQKEVVSLIEQALSSNLSQPRDAAIVALRRLTFPQALDSLARIYGNHEAPEIRDACLQSIALVGTDEACEFLLDVVRSNSNQLAQRAHGLLEKHAQERMLSALERNRRQEPDPSVRIFIGGLIEQVRARRSPAGYG